MKKQKILILIILISSFMITIGYSSFSKNLGIEDLTAIVREQSDIRITGISVNKVTNDAISTYEEYDRDNISIGIELPNDTSSITYNIEIFNYGNVYNILNKIEGLPSNLEYTISGYEEGTIICNIANICNLGIGRDIKLTIKYKDDTNTTSQTKYSLMLLFDFQQAQTEFTFDYTGDYQTFTAPYEGNYKIELWGAAGAPSSAYDDQNIGYGGGRGAYTSAIIHLEREKNLFVYVGESHQRDNTTSYSFNGGSGYISSSYGGGGGATDVRLINGEWDNFESLKSRIMVAAGGSGSYSISRAAGGIIGNNTINSQNDFPSFGTDGTQIFGGRKGKCNDDSSGGTDGYFGKGGIVSYNTGGTGSGYFGGGAGTFCTGNNFGGQSGSGSSFISGHAGSVSILDSSTSDNIVFRNDSNGIACNSELSSTYNELGYNTDYECSKHYSGYVFTNTIMIDGLGYPWTTEKGTEVVGMPTHDGKSTMIGNTGNGYAKITYLGMEMNTNYEFDYTGDEQIFIVPEDGYYKLETWGASGGFSRDENVPGGYGGYSNGKIYLNARDVIYINIGGKGIDGTTTTDNKKGGYNGGGDSYYFSHENCYSGSGGGATHIATKSGLLFTLEDYQENILIVSGGGGGASGDYTSSSPGSSFGGSGGGIKGADSYNIVGTMNSGPGYGGTQTSGGNFYQSEYSGQIGSFGKGADSTSGTNKGGPGAGGGYYGGGSGGGHFGSGGGSGYIGNEGLYDKVMYCYNCQESSEESTKTISTTNVSEEPMSGYAKIGNGYAKITYLSTYSNLENNNVYLYGNTDQRLPKEYQATDYTIINNQSSFNNHLNTGIKWNEASRIVFKNKVINHPSSPDITSIVFVSSSAEYNSNNSNYPCVLIGNGGDYVEYIGSQIKVNVLEANFSQLKNQTNIFDVDNIERFPNNSYITFGSWVDRIWSVTAKWYSFKIFDGDDIVAELVPCYRKEDEEAGFYDIVKNQFMTINENYSGEKFTIGTKSGVGNLNENEKYELPIIITHKDETIENITITINEPLKKDEEIIDILDLKNKKILRNIDLNNKNNYSANIEYFEFDDTKIDFNNIKSVIVNTNIQPSAIVIN